MQFLVDLARPSHLGTNPFLRGFYFTGVRPVVMDDVVAAPAVPVEVAEAAFDGGRDTNLSRRGCAGAGGAGGDASSGGSRRMPQWVFLTSLFNDVLVKDRVALATSGSSSQVNLLRRIALGAVVLAGIDLPDGLCGFVFPQPCAGDSSAGCGRRLAHSADREQPGGECRRSAKAR